MTAAHCTEHVDAEELLVVVGEHDLSVHDDNGRAMAVRAIHEHPDYDDWSFGYDFALLELMETLNFSSNVRSACLPTEEAPYIGVRGAIFEACLNLESYMIGIIRSISCGHRMGEPAIWREFTGSTTGGLGLRSLQPRVQRVLLR